jgi:hypothetical protein
MEHQTMETFVSDLPKYHVLKPKQQENTARLIAISKKFLKKANINHEDIPAISERTIVLECGHQPNFLPHAGTWKKAFCLNRICNQLIENGNQPVAFFGLADQNISTARLLAKNQIPDLNKNGFMKIGFKIKNDEKTRSFYRISKPPAGQWQKEINTLELHYRNISEKTKFHNDIIKNQWDQILEILWTSYERAENFAELNSLVFARICSELFNINLFFFLYSEMHHSDFLFLDESKTILRNFRQFNQIYNQEIAGNNLDIPPVLPNHLPFWYECECGVKMDLNPDPSGVCDMTCPVCLKKSCLCFDPDFENLEQYYKKMDFNAVSRNIIMAHGLGVSLFLSGTGGSSVYGRISDRISHSLGFHSPVTLAWQSKDHYLGMMHKIMVWDLMKEFSLSPCDFINGTLQEKTGQKFSAISRNIREAEANNNEKDIKYFNGLENSAKNLVDFTRNMFTATPSFIDILANFQQDTIIKMWGKAISDSEIEKAGYMNRLRADINYPVIFLQEIQPAELPVFYESVRNLGV